MTLNGWLQIAIVLAAVLITARPLGFYMARVFSGTTTILTPVFRPVENALCKIAGVQPAQEQT